MAETLRRIVGFDLPSDSPVFLSVLSFHILSGIACAVLGLVVCNIEIDSEIRYQSAWLEQPSDCHGPSIRNCKREFARGCCAPVTRAARG
jgi:hypothetical protein